ncbi:MAG: hypothetical protein AB7T74_03065 [Clostridia bacterium]
MNAPDAYNLRRLQYGPNEYWLPRHVAAAVGMTVEDVEFFVLRKKIPHRGGRNIYMVRVEAIHKALIREASA